jgi:hypothetical protein
MMAETGKPTKAQKGLVEAEAVLAKAEKAYIAAQAERSSKMTPAATKALIETRKALNKARANYRASRTAVIEGKDDG